MSRKRTGGVSEKVLRRGPRVEKAGKDPEFRVGVEEKNSGGGLGTRDRRDPRRGQRGT